MEVANAAIIPGIAIYLAHAADSVLGLLTWTSFVPMCGLLLLGGLYWRGKLQVLEGSKEGLHRLLATADKVQMPLLAASAICFVAVISSWFVPALSVSLADRVAATVCASLAVLEYVNYYHRQLQHFDHLADLRRLFAGRGFRAAQMAEDLRRFRSVQHSARG